MIIRRAVEFLPKMIFRTYSNYVSEREYASQSVARNERTIEYRFVFECLQKIWPSSVIDIGTGTTALPQLIRNCGYKVTATDNVTDYWPRGLITSSMHNRHYYVVDDNITKTSLGEKFDMALCISTLEHIVDARSAVQGMASLIPTGGHLVITCPYTENSYSKDAYLQPESIVKRHPGYVCQSFSRKQVDEWCKDFGLNVVEQEFWKYWTGKYWSCGEALPRPEKSSVENLHQLSCILLKKK